MIDKIIWQPSFPCDGWDFVVLLDRNFARDMAGLHITPENQRKINELANKELKRKGINWLNPYNFLEDSYLVTCFNIEGNGCWLSTSESDLTRLLAAKENRPLKYETHNCRFQSQQSALQKIFDTWIRYADVVKGLSKS